jgi:serine/threonine-protein kinase
MIGEDGATLLFVPKGDFIMGASADDMLQACGKLRPDCRREWFKNVEPARTVTLDAFWIDETEVTNKMYKACVDAGACKPPFQSNSETRKNYFGNPEYDDYPVTYVTWEHANAYCTWAGRKLPTEAEWEKAARGTDGRVYPWGNEVENETLLNYSLKVGDTTPVKAYPLGVSPYGAYDMAGNIWEWVADWYDPAYYQTAPSVNPMGPDSGETKVSRGGAWIFYDFDMFATDRYGNYPQTTNSVIGFRCARPE